MTAGHAAAMDRMYRLQRHIYDLTRRPYLLGRDSTIAALCPPPGGSVLEVGCGTARNLVAIGRRWPTARLYGIDISAEMLASARTNVARAGMDGRVTLALGDAATIDPMAAFGIARFDRILMSYTLSMIPGWRDVIAAAVAALAPEGMLSIVDFGQQERLPRWWRVALMAWLGHWHVTPRADLFQAAAEAAGGRPVRCEALLRGYAWSARIGGPDAA